MTGAAMPMMAALMLPGAAPTVVDRVRADGRLRAGVRASDVVARLSPDLTSARCTAT